MAAENNKPPEAHGPNNPAKPTDKKTAQDDSVMATNSSSIVSKRSVERLYYPDKKQFFRFFVKKFQQKAPLINRGYHLTLHVIDVILRNFLKTPSTKKKVVVNLGAGYDVIPWQCWTRYPEHCENTVFVDVDFPELTSRKRQVVLETTELTEQLSGVQPVDDNGILLRSDRYYQIGCDLRYTAKLEKALASIVDIAECHFIFVAEVSITYMETPAADDLIKWASSFAQAEFCLLEQVLPSGPDHPFAKTMMGHFDKLDTSIKSVRNYPKIQDQQARFLSRKWTSLMVQSLWSAWADDFFLSAQDRRKLDQVEPFDDWEEFALFADHYFILHAKNYGGIDEASMPIAVTCSETPSLEVSMCYKQCPGQHGTRRFGAPMLVNDALGNEFIVNCMGLGANARLSSYDVHVPSGGHGHIDLQPEGPSSRMCHTLTDLGHHGFLLVGGRSSPSQPMNDCWLFKKDALRWERTWDLPIPLYRHSICRMGESSLALLVGGKSRSCTVSSMAFIYHPEKGWLECEVQGSIRPGPVFGAILASSGCDLRGGSDFHGLLSGGISDDGLINSQILLWKVDVEIDVKRPLMTFTTCLLAGKDAAMLLPRFGAACIHFDGYLMIFGGISRDGIISQADEILVCSLTKSKCEILGRVINSSISSEHQVPRPLLVGSSVLASDGQIVIMGGGATCFSMGTFWNGIYSFALDLTRLQLTSSEMPLLHAKGWEYAHSGKIAQKKNSGTQVNTINESPEPPTIKVIPRVKVESKEVFEKLLRNGSPAILEGLDIGSCCSAWSLEHLTKQIDRKVTVHEANTQKMDFNAKNFRYTIKDFSTFASEVSSGGRLYLRSLSEAAPSNQPAQLNEDYPSLAAEFSLPEELSFVTENMHSSVLRISGPVNMWLHYDVMANVYCQITGSKRLLLFPPADVMHLSIPPGASSSSIDVFGLIDTPALAATHPHEASLSSGDVLFLPPLWLHTATPTSNVSVAVNVFFRSLEAGYSAGRDVYANRDFAGYEKGRVNITKIANAFNKVPRDVRHFYMSRLANELMEKAAEDC